MNSDLLIATNGFGETWPAIEYGAFLAETLNKQITLFGVNENLSPSIIDDHHPLEEIFPRAIALFEKMGVRYRLEVQNGNAEEAIPARAAKENVLVVTGPLGRPQIRRFLAGRSIRHLMEEIKNPIIYVPRAKFPIKKILLCMGGLGYEITAEHIAMQIAAQNCTEITLLHVVPPMDLDYPTAKTVQNHWENLQETDTPIGRRIRQALNAARQDGLTTVVKARKGNVVEEILAEVKEGDYDLLCMGSPYSANALRQLYVPNVTAEIADVVTCPILTARFQKD